MINRYLNQTCQIENVDDYDPEGKPTYETAFTAKCRIVFKQEIAFDDRKKEYLIDGKVFLKKSTDIKEEAKITFSGEELKVLFIRKSIELYGSTLFQRANFKRTNE